jgi:hypothetical protein
LATQAELAVKPTPVPPPHLPAGHLTAPASNKTTDSKGSPVLPDKPPGND